MIDDRDSPLGRASPTAKTLPFVAVTQSLNTKLKGMRQSVQTGTNALKTDCLLVEDVRLEAQCTSTSSVALPPISLFQTFPVIL